MYTDQAAIISQQDGDVGDSLQRESMYFFGQWYRYNRTENKLYLPSFDKARATPQEIISKFEIEPGIYVRNPDSSNWASNPDTTSRDQVIPVIAYCAAYEDYPRLLRLFKATAVRGMFAQNTLRIGETSGRRKIPDTMIMNLSLFIRAGGWWTAPLYPLLFIFDGVDLLGTIVSTFPAEWDASRQVLRWKTGDDVDDNNTIIQHLVAAEWKPTPASFLNRYFYSITRAQNDGNFVLHETNPVMGALAWYHRREFNGNPEMAEVYRPLIEKYFTFESPVQMVRKWWGNGARKQETRIN
jgi:hypothetical protein